MIRHLESQDYFYLVKCSDLECMVLSSSFEEAASQGLQNIIKKYGKSTNLSFWLSVDYIKEYEIETKIFYTPNVLNDLGHFKLAKDLSCLSDFFLDKGENPH